MTNYFKTADLNKNFPESKNLSELIESLSLWAHKRGQVICSISVNGVHLNEQEEKKFAQVPLNQIEEIKIQTQTPQMLLDESLIDCREHLKKLMAGYEQIATLFRKGDAHHAHRSHRFAIDGMQQFFEVVSYYGQLFESVRGPLPPLWHKLEKKLPEVLDQILDSYEKKDYFLVADLLEYDLLSVLEEWDRLINQICDENDKQNPEAVVS